MLTDSGLSLEKLASSGAMPILRVFGTLRLNSEWERGGGSTPQ